MNAAGRCVVGHIITPQPPRSGHKNTYTANMTADAKEMMTTQQPSASVQDDNHEGSGKLLIQRYSPSEFIHNGCTAVANAVQEPGGCT